MKKWVISKPYVSPHFKKGKSKTIFTVCGMENFKVNSLHRTFGWYSKPSLALDAVKKNNCDLYECAYQYIVVEEVKEGVFGLAIKEWWHKWDKKEKKFLPISKPKETNGIINWSM
jgi:hypothetical protein